MIYMNKIILATYSSDVIEEKDKQLILTEGRINHVSNRGENYGSVGRVISLFQWIKIVSGGVVRIFFLEYEWYF